MRRTLSIFCAITFFAFGFIAFAEDQAAPQSSGLVDELSKKLQLKPEQATGAAGSVFSLAKNKLPAEDFTKLASGFPEMDTLLKAAPAATSDAAGSLTAAISSQSGALGLANQFKNLGISPETATKIVPEVLNFVKAKQGDAMMSLLSKAIQ